MYFYRRDLSLFSILLFLPALTVICGYTAQTTALPTKPDEAKIQLLELCKNIDPQYRAPLRCDSDDANDKRLLFDKRHKVGLLWPPIQKNGYTFSVVKPHFGYAGPKVGHVTHFNVRIDKKRLGRPVANFHISGYKQQRQVCIYVWDSANGVNGARGGKVLLDTCYDTIEGAAQEAVSRMWGWMRDALDQVDFTMSFLITAIAAVLTTLLAPVVA